MLLRDLSERRRLSIGIGLGLNVEDIELLVQFVLLK